MTALVLTTCSSPREGDTPDLPARIAAGDSGAFDELVRLYQLRVTRLAHRLVGYHGDVEDIVQDVFVVALRKTGGFKGDCSLWTWLTVITLNRCRSHHRHHKVVRKAMTFLAGKKAGVSQSADQPALADEAAREIRAAVSRLRRKYREVVVLFYLEHKSIREIAELLGTSQRAVEIRLHRSRAVLRDLLQSMTKAMP